MFRYSSISTSSTYLNSDIIKSGNFKTILIDYPVALFYKSHLYIAHRFKKNTHLEIANIAVRFHRKRKSQIHVRNCIFLSKTSRKTRSFISFQTREPQLSSSAVSRNVWPSGYGRWPTECFASEKCHRSRCRNIAGFRCQ